MYAPPGVDSSSSGEEITPPPSPIPTRVRPKFSFRSLFSPSTPERSSSGRRRRRNTLSKPTNEEIKHSTPIEAAEADSELPTNPLSPKKRVRIFAGELEEGQKARGLTNNLGEDVRDSLILAKNNRSNEEDKIEVGGSNGISEEVLEMMRRLTSEQMEDEQARLNVEEERGNQSQSPLTSPLSPPLTTKASPKAIPSHSQAADEPISHNADPQDASKPTDILLRLRSSASNLSKKRSLKSLRSLKLNKKSLASQPIPPVPPIPADIDDEVVMISRTPIADKFARPLKLKVDEESRRFNGQEEPRTAPPGINHFDQHVAPHGTAEEYYQRYPEGASATQSPTCCPHCHSPTIPPGTAPPMGYFPYDTSNPPPISHQDRGWCQPPGWPVHHYHPVPSPSNVQGELVEPPMSAPVVRDNLSPPTPLVQRRPHQHTVKASRASSSIPAVEAKKLNEDEVPRMKAGPVREIVRQKAQTLDSSRGEIVESTKGENIKPKQQEKERPTNESRNRAGSEVRDKPSTPPQAEDHRAETPIPVAKGISPKLSAEIPENPSEKKKADANKEQTKEITSKENLAVIVKQYKVKYSEAMKVYKTPDLSEEEKNQAQERVRRVEGKLKEAMQALENHNKEFKPSPSGIEERQPRTEEDEAKPKPKSEHKFTPNTEAVHVDSSTDKRKELEEMIKKYQLRIHQAKKAYSKEGIPDDQKKKLRDQIKSDEGKMKEAIQALDNLKLEKQGVDHAVEEKEREVVTDVSATAKGVPSSREILKEDHKSPQAGKVESEHKKQDKEVEIGRPKKDEDKAKEPKQVGENRIQELEKIVQKYQMRYKHAINAYKTEKLSDEKKQELKVQIKDYEGKTKEAMQALEAYKAEQKAKSTDADRVENGRKEREIKVEEQGSPFKDPPKGRPERKGETVSEKADENAIPAEENTQSGEKITDSELKKDGEVQKIEKMVEKYQMRYKSAVTTYKTEKLSEQDKAKVKGEIKMYDGKMKEALQALEQARKRSSEVQGQNGKKAEIRFPEQVPERKPTIPSAKDAVSKERGKRVGDAVVDKSEGIVSGSKESDGQSRSSQEEAERQVKKYQMKYKEAVKTYKSEVLSEEERKTAKEGVKRAEAQLREATQSLESMKKHIKAKDSKPVEGDKEQLPSPKGDKIKILAKEEVKPPAKEEVETSTKEVVKSPVNQKVKSPKGDAVKSPVKEQAISLTKENVRPPAKEKVQRSAKEVVNSPAKEEFQSLEKEADKSLAKEEVKSPREGDAPVREEAKVQSHKDTRGDNHNSQGSKDTKRDHDPNLKELHALVKKYEIRYNESVKAYSAPGLSEEEKKEAKVNVRRAEGKLKEANQALQKSQAGHADRDEKKEVSDQKVKSESREEKRVPIEEKNDDPESIKRNHSEKQQDDTKEQTRGTTSPSGNRQQVEELEVVVKKYQKLYEEAVKAYKSQNLSEEAKKESKENLKRAEAKLKQAMQALTDSKTRTSDANADKKDLKQRDIAKDKPRPVVDVSEDVAPSTNRNRNNITDDGGVATRVVKAEQKEKEAANSAVGAIAPAVDKDVASRETESAQTEKAVVGVSKEQLEGELKKLKIQYGEVVKVYKSDKLSDADKRKAKEKVAYLEGKIKKVQKALLEHKDTEGAGEKAISPKMDKIVDQTEEKSKANAKIVDLEEKLKKYNAAYESAVKTYKSSGLSEEDRSKAKERVRAMKAKKDQVEQELDTVRKDLKSGKDKNTKAPEDAPKESSPDKEGKGNKETPSSEIKGETEVPQAEEQILKDENRKALENEPSESKDRKSDELKVLRSKYDTLVTRMESSEITAAERQKSLHTAEAIKRKMKELRAPTDATVVSPTSPSTDSSKRDSHKDKQLRNAKEKYAVLKQRAKEEGLDEEERKRREAEIAKQAEVVKSLMRDQEKHSSAVNGGQPQSSSNKRKGKGSVATPQDIKVKGTSETESQEKGSKHTEISSASDLQISPPSEVMEIPGNGRSEDESKSKTVGPDEDHQAWAPLRVSREKSPSPPTPPKSPARRAIRQLLPEHTTEEGVTWSKTLISLANCIDLANRILTSLHNSPSSNPLSEVVQHLIVGLMIQKDLVASLKEVIGESNSGLIDEFGEHVTIIKSYVVDLLKKEKEGKLDKTEVVEVDRVIEKGSQVLESATIQSIVSHLVAFTEYLTPGMINTLKEVADEWKREGLGMKVIIHTVLAIRTELAVIEKAKERSKEVEDSKHTKGLINVLDKVLALFSNEQAESHKGLGSDTVAQARITESIHKGFGHEQSRVQEDVIVARPSKSITKDVNLADGRRKDDQGEMRMSGGLTEKELHHREHHHDGMSSEVTIHESTYNAQAHQHHPQTPVPTPVPIAGLPVCSSDTISSSNLPMPRSHTPLDEPPSSLAYLVNKISDKLHHKPRSGPSPSEVEDEKKKDRKSKLKPKSIISSPSSIGDNGKIPRRKSDGNIYEKDDELLRSQWQSSPPLRLPKTTEEFLNNNNEGGGGSKWKDKLKSPTSTSRFSRPKVKRSNSTSSSFSATYPFTAPLPPISNLTPQSKSRHHDMEDDLSPIVYTPNTAMTATATQSTIELGSSNKSSPSRYSQTSVESDSTAKSDQMAKEMLRNADSGPGAVKRDWRDDLTLDSESDKGVGPSDDQVKRAKEVLYHKVMPVPTPIKTDRTKRGKLEVNYI